MAPPQPHCPMVYRFIGRSWQERWSRVKPPQRESLAVVPTSSGQQPGYGAQRHQLNGAGSPKGSRGTSPRAEAGVDMKKGRPPLALSLQVMAPCTAGRVLWAGCIGAVPPSPGRKMWEPRAAASPLPQTRSLLIKPLSICLRLHGSSPSALAQCWQYYRAD